MRLNLIVLLKFTFIFIVFSLAAQLLAPPRTSKHNDTSTWAESVFDYMTVDERLAQLFMIEVRPTYGPQHIAYVEKTIRDHQVGGVIFFKGNPT